jgi:hypothetical protein
MRTPLKGVTTCRRKLPRKEESGDNSGGDMRIAIAAAAVLLVSCASITDGTNQTIIIPVQPREARCNVVRNDVELGVITGTQQTITVSKGARDIILNCSAPGYINKSARLVSTTQTEGMMSFLFLDLGITDMVTGAMWKYPQSTSIILERDPAAAPPAAPGVSPMTVTPASPLTPGQPLVTVSAAPPAQGKDAVMAERFARESGCTRDTLATMIGKGPGYENYSFACMNGETLVVRCEFGTCRALK